MSTLDMAIDAFKDDPTNKRAGDLLLIARRYWLDDMIGDESFDAVLITIQSYLRK
jgi:hypothetical protein